jgi:hypothetical protein
MDGMPTVGGIGSSYQDQIPHFGADILEFFNSCRNGGHQLSCPKGMINCETEGCCLGQEEEEEEDEEDDDENYEDDDYDQENDDEDLNYADDHMTN